MTRLTITLRERAIGIIQAGIGMNNVSRAIGCKRLTLYRLQQRFHGTGSTVGIPRSGRPQVATIADDRFIRIRHLRVRFMPPRASTGVVQGRRISAQTVRRRLRSFDLRPRRAYRGPTLTIDTDKSG
ncbi:uncharacterized protein [Mytilus edulis]|uniref:uncharacterized protein n=1 Tax=Mytilus edulis TaxID=6550 RepID=UPI0039EFC2CF